MLCLLFIKFINSLLRSINVYFVFFLLGLYMPCNGMLIAALFIRAFSLHVDMRLEREDASQVTCFIKQPIIHYCLLKLNLLTSQLFQDVDPNIAGTCTMFLIAHGIGFMADAGSNIVSMLTFANSRIRTMVVYSAMSAFSFIIPLLVFPRYVIFINVNQASNLVV